MSGTEAGASVLVRLRPDHTERLEALLIGAGPHLAAVQDVGTTGNGDLLLVLRAPAARLPGLLQRRLTAGEAVTVLVPLAQALQRLHDAGVAHGGVGADSVQLDADGSPSWGVPDAPTLRRRSGTTAFAAAVDADVVAFRRLCGALLGPVGLRVPEGQDLAALAAAVYALAPPEPVRLDPVAEAPIEGPPSRLVPASPVAGSVPAGGGAGPRTAVALAGVLRGLAAVRVRVWVALGAVAALLVAATVLLPAQQQAPAAVRPSGTPRASTSSRPSGSAQTARSAAPTDVLTAVRALLAARDHCLQAGSEACLRRVDAAGSPVLQADLVAVRAGTEPVRIDPARLRVPVTGGPAVVGTAGEATVLAVRQQNGWRLRDVVAEPPEDRSGTG